ncbi:uncharacterized protein [Diadema setosum]|uniref:uncharacterized protein n=1 Tax=Diadema setosum TaxID=31175 RepID=UPI003B3B3653
MGAVVSRTRHSTRRAGVEAFDDDFISADKFIAAEDASTSNMSLSDDHSGAAAASAGDGDVIMAPVFAPSTPRLHPHRPLCEGFDDHQHRATSDSRSSTTREQVSETPSSPERRTVKEAKKRQAQTPDFWDISQDPETDIIIMSSAERVSSLTTEEGAGGTYAVEEVGKNDAVTEPMSERSPRVFWMNDEKVLMDFMDL